MNNEKILNAITPIVNARKTHKDDNLYRLQLNSYQLDMLQGLLDLYNKEKLNSFNLSEQLNKEKEKNKELEEEIMEQDLMIAGLKENRRIAVEEIQEQYYVSKDKIKEIIDKIDAEDYYCLNEAEEDLRKLVE